VRSIEQRTFSENQNYAITLVIEHRTNTQRPISRFNQTVQETVYPYFKNVFEPSGLVL